jgi:hypothetical protein
MSSNWQFSAHQLLAVASVTIVLLATTRSLRSVKRAVRSSRDLKKSGRNGLLKNANRRTLRTEWVLLYVQAVILLACTIFLINPDAPGSVDETIAILRTLSAIIVAWRCNADYRDREAASGYYARIAELDDSNRP